jgi:hypothetical protein
MVCGCRHPKDRVPPHTRSNSRQGAGRASTRCHASCNFRPHLPAEVWFGAATCPTARTSPPCRGELRCCHMPRGPGPHLLAELSSGAATCSSASDLTCQPRLASALPRVPWPQALPPREESSGAATCPMALSSASSRGELRCCHVFLSSGPHLPAKVGFGAAMWPRPCLPERRALVLPRTP